MVSNKSLFYCKSHSEALFFLLVCICVILSCKSGTGPEPEPIPLQLDITSVSISDSTLMSRYTSIFQCFYEEDTTNSEIRFSWKLEQADGTRTDTLTEVDRFYWQAPSEPGTYEHSVKLVTEDGEPVSEEFPFSVNVTRWQELPQIHTLTGRFVFSREVDDEYQIFSSNADGTNTRQLTHFDTRTGSFNPAWSSDGTKIVFETDVYASTGLASLFVMNSDGSEAELLSGSSRNPMGGRNPVWSPDGTKIAFNTGDSWRNSDIYIYDIESDTRTQITTHNSLDEYPAWSPDGKKLVFSSARDGVDGSQDLYIINNDGTGLERITFSGKASRPKWGADFRTIVYDWQFHEYNSYMLDLSTGSNTNLNQLINVEATGYPMLSHSDMRLLLPYRETLNSEVDMMLLNINENKSTEIITDGINYNLDLKWIEN